MNATWYVRRLRRMSPGEVVGRARDEVVKRSWRRRWVHDSWNDPLEVPSAVPMFATPLPPSARDGVPRDAHLALIQAADELLAGRWWIFDRQRHDMTPAPNWFLDPRTGHLAPATTYCFAIDHRREDLVGSVKHVWELSRHQHCTLLASAYYLTNDPRYAQAAAEQLRSWWEQNPFLSGINWTSGIELGIRLIAWVWVRRLLHSWSGVDELFERNRVFLQQLHHHQEYLDRLPSRGSSANNHLLAEAAGQFVACCAFPYFAESAPWRDRAAATLRRELPSQTFSCGLNRELASCYHGFVLELALAAALEGEASAQPLGREVWNTIRNMVDALAAIVDVRCQPPRQGDGDDADGLLLDPPYYSRWPSLLATGEVLFGRLGWWPSAPSEDVRTPLWTSLAEAPETNGDRPPRRSSLFPEAGMTILRDRAQQPDEVWCRLDHGPHGFLAIAAHAHADALALELRMGGVDVFADTGTYCYHGEPDWRHYFRSTAGHNTLEVAGLDQSISGGPFLWTRHANSQLRGVSGLDGGAVAEWQASHDGYGRLRPPATHRRHVRLARSSREIVITDVLVTERAHTCRLRFHLGPGVACKLDGHRALLSWKTSEAEWSASLTLPTNVSWEEARGRIDQPAGWYSPAFGVRIPTVTLIGTGLVAGREQLVTRLRWASESTASALALSAVGQLGRDQSAIAEEHE